MVYRKAVLGVTAGMVLNACSLAAFERAAMSPRAMGLGNAALAASADAWTFFANPADVPFSGSFSAGFFHIPGLFGLGELQFSGGGLALPVDGSGFACAISRLGGRPYSETTLALSFGQELMPGFSVGLSGKMNGLSITGYGSCWDFTVDVGVRVECTKELTVSGLLTNATGTTLGASGEELPQELTGGIAYTPVAGVSCMVTASKELLMPLELRCGIEVDIMEPLNLRAGIVDNPSTVTGGCSIRIGDVSVDYACAYHWLLGMTHEIGISIRLH
jgi:hypothetical protein